MKLRILIAGLLFGAVAFAADKGAELFQRAVTQERAAGNLEEAIKLYQRVATEFASDRPLAAKALVREAQCYEKLGQGKAVKVYEQVAKDYRDQAEPVAMANARLVALRTTDHAPAPPSMTQRKLELPNAGAGATYLTSDGLRRVVRDGAAGTLTMSDLAGNGKRVFFKLDPKLGHLNNFLVSRDFSLVVMNIDRPDKTRAYAVVRTDGTGFREFSGDWSGDWPCTPEISWDNRFLLVCRLQPEKPAELVRISVADGEMRQLPNAGAQRYMFSPDGRFIAYTEGSGADGRIFTMASDGGEPQLVSEGAFSGAEGAFVSDWTADGRYLIINSRTAGADALHVLPVKGGQGAGKPLFVRYGRFFGRTAGNGAFIYQAPPQIGYYTPWLAKLDANGHLLSWEKLSLSGGARHFPTWSPDSTQFAYVAYEDAAGQATGNLRVRNVESGEERELFQGVGMSCFWSARKPSIFCVGAGSALPALSIATDTGRAESLGVWPVSDGWSLFRTRDDKTIFAASIKYGLKRWEIGSAQWTPVEGVPLGLRGQFTALASPDERWITRWVEGKIEIRPMAGGDWKPLISIENTAQAGFTSDGNWLYYKGLDSPGKYGLYRVATSGGEPERLGDFPGTRSGQMWISPDGRKIITDISNPTEVWELENFEPKP